MIALLLPPLAMLEEGLRNAIWNIAVDYVYEDDADAMTERIWDLLLSELGEEE